MWDFFLFQQISSGYLMHFQTTLLEIWIYIYFLESFFKDTSPRGLELKRFIEVFHICVPRKPAELQVLCVSPTPHKELTLSSWFVILRGWITFLVPDKNSIKYDTLPPAAFPSLQLPVTNRKGVCRIFHRFYLFFISNLLISQGAICLNSPKFSITQIRKKKHFQWHPCFMFLSKSVLASVCRDTR